MRSEAQSLLEAIASYNKAHVGDSDDAEIDAAFQMEEAALALLRRIAADYPDVSELIEEFDKEAARTSFEIF